ncbi:MAG: HhH-GPD-type base excision DNA repair protein [Solirubrobacteraceae bacterium]
MIDQLHFTDSDEANALLASDSMALLIGFALDQQVTVQKAFSGPLVIRERVGSLDATTLAGADLETTFRERPAIHRFPVAMAKRVSELAATVRDEYGGDAGRIWSQATDTADLRARLGALPGFGEMKVVSLGAVLAKRFGVKAAEGLVPDHPTLGDVDSADALAAYQAGKREHKARLRAAKGAA